MATETEGNSPNKEDIRVSPYTQDRHPEGTDLDSDKILHICLCKIFTHLNIQNVSNILAKKWMCSNGLTQYPYVNSQTMTASVTRWSLYIDEIAQSCLRGFDGEFVSGS